MSGEYDKKHIQKCAMTCMREKDCRHDDERGKETINKTMFPPSAARNPNAGYPQNQSREIGEKISSLDKSLTRGILPPRKGCADFAKGTCEGFAWVLLHITKCFVKEPGVLRYLVVRELLDCIDIL